MSSQPPEPGRSRTRRYRPADSLDTPRFSGVRTFARLPAIGDLDGADVAIVGLPFDTGGTYRVGARFGPEGIRSASVMLRPYSDALGVAPFEELSVVDFGDLGIVPGYISESLERIRLGILSIVSAGVVPIGLGGDHSVTLGELRAIAEHYGPVGFVQLDSHTDTNESYFGKPYMHGTPFWHAFHEGLLDASRAIQVGLRGSTYNAQEYEIPRSFGFEVIPAAEVHRSGIEAVATRIRDRVGTGPAFLTLDIDFLDPAYAPATGTPEVGGFTTWQLQLLLRSLVGINLIACDVVEVIPSYDVSATTALAAANAVYDLLALLARARADRS